MLEQAVTVKQLIKNLKALEKQGYGDAKILMSVDDEMNSVRALYYAATTIDDELTMEFIQDECGFTEANENNIILLG